MYGRKLIGGLKEMSNKKILILLGVFAIGGLLNIFWWFVAPELKWALIVVLGIILYAVVLYVLLTLPDDHIPKAIMWLQKKMEIGANKRITKR